MKIMKDLCKMYQMQGGQGKHGPKGKRINATVSRISKVKHAMTNTTTNLLSPDLSIDSKPLSVMQSSCLDRRFPAG